MHSNLSDSSSHSLNMKDDKMNTISAIDFMTDSIGQHLNLPFKNLKQKHVQTLGVD